MSAEVDIANMALGHLGISTEIQNLTTEASKEARAARRYYNLARDKTLRDFDWPFASTIEDIQLVLTNPTVEWAYSYRYPANAVAIRRILNGATRMDTESTKVRFELGRDAIGQIILTSQTAAEIRYTYRETNPERYPPDFEYAFSLLLAHMMAPRVASDVKFAQRVYPLYKEALSEAKTNSANEEPAERQPEAELIRAREA